MDLAWISIAALVLAVGLSCPTTINVGALLPAMAWPVGLYLGGMSVEAVLEGFPTPLLVTLIAVTLLFGIAECNGIDALPIAWSMNIGASLVDASSLSTVGAFWLLHLPAPTRDSCPTRCLRGACR